MKPRLVKIFLAASFVFLVLQTEMVLAQERVNGGPAQLPSQNVLQPPPNYTAPNLKGNVQSSGQAATQPAVLEDAANPEILPREDTDTKSAGGLKIWLALALVALFAFVYYVFKQSQKDSNQAP